MIACLYAALGKTASQHGLGVVGVSEHGISIGTTGRLRLLGLLFRIIGFGTVHCRGMLKDKAIRQVDEGFKQKY